MSFSRVRGQPRAAKIVEGILSSERVPSALLFSGLEGVGKTLMARELAKALLCQAAKKPAEPCGGCGDCAAIDKNLHLDVKIADAAYQAGLLEGEAAKQKTLRVDTMRHLRKDMELESMLGRWKVAVVCEAHTMEVEASNALLKALEEPLPKTLWILVTAQKDRLPKTVLSRCFTVPFTPLAPEIVAKLLRENGLPEQQASRLAELGDGSVSRALELAKAADYPDGLRGTPLSAVEAAESLPKELYLARTQVELALFALAQDVRQKHLDGRLPFTRAEKPLRELGRLRQALRSNADPKSVLLLAALETEGL